MVALTSERAREIGKMGGRPIEWTKERIDALADRLEEWIADKHHYYIGSFLVQEKLDSNELERFASIHPRFSRTLKNARQAQEDRLVSLALERKHDGNFTRFVLANRAGWRERTEIAGDPQAPLVQLLASVDGKSKAIIEEAQVIQPEQIEHKDHTMMKCKRAKQALRARQQAAGKRK